jgi:DNA-binding NarL/FixJ family response regulator
MPSEDESDMEDRREVSVLIVDDQVPFRLAARAVLRRAEGFELVGEAADGAEAVTRVAELSPDLVLMDINMPTMNGIDATRQIMQDAPGTTVFLCSTYQRSDLPPEAETAGAAAYVNKEELAPDLLRRLWDERPAAAASS